MNQLKESLNKEIILAFLRENKDFLHSKFGVTKIGLFGSYVRGEQTLASDIDILIETSDNSFKTWFDLKEFLELRFNKKTDVIDIKGLRTFIRRMIDEEVIYA